MSAEEILKLIETVDPSDTAKLDEIDARVWCWLAGGWEVTNERTIHYADRSVTEKGVFFVPDKGTAKGVAFDKITWSPKYTRSRDALKSIRPEGWIIQVSPCNGRYQGFALKPDQRGLPFETPILPEELAELHAIIQAIKYERNQEENNG